MMIMTMMIIITIITIKTNMYNIIAIDGNKMF
jgi:hypothetical protein